MDVLDRSYLLSYTFERNEWSFTPDRVETRSILKGHKGF